MPNGKLLVLDGLDGSGKSTQFELLQTALQKQGVSIQAVSFPDYDSPSAALVKMYLNGELSNTPDGVNAYAASSFYAVDRYANYHLHWEQAYHNGTCILASRYTTSNPFCFQKGQPQDYPYCSNLTEKHYIMWCRILLVPTDVHSAKMSSKHLLYFCQKFIVYFFIIHYIIFLRKFIHFFIKSN